MVAVTSSQQLRGGQPPLQLSLRSGNVLQSLLWCAVIAPCQAWRSSPSFAVLVHHKASAPLAQPQPKACSNCLNHPAGLFQHSKWQFEFPCDFIGRPGGEHSFEVSTRSTGRVHADTANRANTKRPGHQSCCRRCLDSSTHSSPACSTRQPGCFWIFSCCNSGCQSELLISHSA